MYFHSRCHATPEKALPRNRIIGRCTTSTRYGWKPGKVSTISPRPAMAAVAATAAGPAVNRFGPRTVLVGGRNSCGATSSARRCALRRGAIVEVFGYTNPSKFVTSHRVPAPSSFDDDPDDPNHQVVRTEMQDQTDAIVDAIRELDLGVHRQRGASRPAGSLTSPASSRIPRCAGPTDAGRVRRRAPPHARTRLGADAG